MAKKQKQAIQLFQEKKIRTLWDEELEKWYFSIVDVVSVLTEQPDARHASTYWAVLKKRLKNEGADQLLTNCSQLNHVVTQMIDGIKIPRRIVTDRVIIDSNPCYLTGT